jgi:hypothetical protein
MSESTRTINMGAKGPGKKDAGEYLKNIMDQITKLNDSFIFYFLLVIIIIISILSLIYYLINILIIFYLMIFIIIHFVYILNNYNLQEL